MHARARALPSPYKSKLESRFAGRLEALRIAGAIQEWRYEPFSFVLAKNTRYKPDFFVLNNDDTITFYEVKGVHANMRASRVAFKAAAALNPWFEFVWATENRGGGWNEEQYN